MPRVKVVAGHTRVAKGPSAVVAIGNFDGVHLGHRALLDRARALGALRGGHAVALTFDPHPAQVLAPENAPLMLTSLDRRLELLAAAGAELVVVEPFTRQLAGVPADTFIDDVVIRALGATAIVVGYDFCYGAARSGTTESLRNHGERVGVHVEVMPAVEVEGEVASSTRIRHHLREGALPAAARLLGREWDVDGVVAHGAKRGRAIGVPTANIVPVTELPIRPGIYAVRIGIDGEDLPAVASFGTNPTFTADGALVLEVHVLDWSGDLYDRRLRTTFVAYLRDEATFSSTTALLDQIRADIAKARALL